jgi:hypothetical protein
MANDFVNAYKAGNLARCAMTQQHKFGTDAIEALEVPRKILMSAGSVDPGMQIATFLGELDKFVSVFAGYPPKDQPLGVVQRSPLSHTFAVYLPKDEPLRLKGCLLSHTWGA